MEEHTEVIQREMEHTREDLGEKVQALSDKVTEDLTAAGESVTKTVETVSEGVQNTMAAVRGALDFQGHVRAHPWLMVGGAVIAGYLAHELLMPSRSAEPEAAHAPSRDGRQSTGWTGDLFNRWFGKSWENIQHFAAHTALDLAGRGAREMLPGDLGESVGKAVDDMKTEMSHGQQAQTEQPS